MMAIVEAQEHMKLDSSNPLEQPEILQHVLDHVGPGHWCFVAEVSSLWRDLYIRVARSRIEVVDCCSKKETITCVPQMTMYSAVFASPSRVTLAQEYKLDFEAGAYEYAAGMHADVPTLKAAHELHMRYTYSVMEGALRRDKLTTLRFLHTQGCPWDAGIFMAAAARGHTDMCAYLRAEHCPWNEMVCYHAALNGHAGTLRWLREQDCPWYADTVHLAAAQGGSVEALQFLQQQGIVFDADMLNEMLCTAGAYNKLAAAKWLRQQGAAWPAVLMWKWQSWSGESLLWARAEGCTSSVW
jgi:hypothetical protein